MPGWFPVNPLATRFAWLPAILPRVAVRQGSPGSALARTVLWSVPPMVLPNSFEGAHMHVGHLLRGASALLPLLPAPWPLQALLWLSQHGAGDGQGGFPGLE